MSEANDNRYFDVDSIKAKEIVSHLNCAALASLCELTKIICYRVEIGNLLPHAIRFVATKKAYDRSITEKSRAVCARSRVNGYNS